MYRNKLVLLFSLCLFFISGYSQKAYYVSTLAGDTAGISKGIDSNAGHRDGIGSYARFNGPTGIAVDSSGNVYVADTYNNVIRKINVLFNTVTTIAGDTADIKKGLDSNLGYANGTALSAKFSNPIGVCVDKYGNVYVADTYNNVIRKISTSGMVTTYAGKQDSSGIETFSGYVNGPDSIAEFFVPTSLAIDTGGNIYVTDEGNNAIREIVKSTGMVITLAGRQTIDGYINGDTSIAQFSTLFGIALDKSNSIFVSQFANEYNGIRRLDTGTVSTFAGNYLYGFDTLLTSASGYRDGKGTIGIWDTTVLFNDPTGIAFDTAGNLLVADEYNNVIRLVNTKDSVVTTFAGNHYNDSVTFMDGWYDSAVFYNPIGVVADNKGNVYVSDLGNNLIRKIALQRITGVPSVKKQLNNTLTIYPNPCNDKLNIVSTFNGKADLLDVTGRVIWANNGFKSPYTLSTSAISPGIYFLRIASQSESLIRKIEVVK